MHLSFEEIGFVADSALRPPENFAYAMGQGVLWGGTESMEFKRIKVSRNNTLGFQL